MTNILQDSARPAEFVCDRRWHGAAGIVEEAGLSMIRLTGGLLYDHEL